MKVTMKNPTNGKVKEIKVGWSWTIFFFSWFFGIPLFLRGLTAWGIAMVVLLCFSDSRDMGEFAGFIMFCLTIYLAAKGNEMSAKARLKNGWFFLDPDSDTVKYAKGKWGIS